MMSLSNRYRPSLALLTDLYELTMAFGYWKLGRVEEEAVFNLFFRENPFEGGFAVACGLGELIEYLQSFRFDASDLDYLGSLSGNDGQPLFEPAFLDALRTLEFECDLDAIPEGTVVFPHEPLVRVKGPILQCQILESVILNIVNFQTLICTKAARVCAAAEGAPILEFGLRRAQGIDGALAASRAAFIGGCFATSNVLAGKLFGIPVRGTHAHSWVMSFDSEMEAFAAWSQAMPNNCVFLVDTYDTLEGVRRAVEIGRTLRERGHEMVGVRLDSGDLAYLSIEARRILDEGGFPEAQIFASNEVDEHIITSLKDQGAKVTVWGVGTKLVTGNDQPALGGVYKLTAVRQPGREWQYKVKVSEQTAKSTTPGIQQVRRYSTESGFLADMIYDERLGIGSPPVIVDPRDPIRRKVIGEGSAYEDLLVPVFRGGRLVYDPPALPELQQRTAAQLGSLHPGIKRFLFPHLYPAGLEKQLHDLKMKLIFEARGVPA